MTGSGQTRPSRPVAYPPKLPVKADVPLRQLSAISGLMQSSNQPILRKTGTETFIGVLPDCGVAFAREALECRTIHDFDVTAPIADQPRALKQAGRDGNGGAAHAQHLREKFLRKRDVIAVGEIVGL